MESKNKEEEAIEQLTELVEIQDRALKTADAIISLKNKLIEICEKQIDLYRKKNRRLRISLTICGFIVVIDVILSLLKMIL